MSNGRRAAVIMSALLGSYGWVHGQILYSDQTANQGVSFTHHSNVEDDYFIGAGAAWGDYNGDGWPDLYVADQYGPNRLFRNSGNGNGFEDVAVESGVDLPDHVSNGALWGDYDNDDDPDLYVFARGENILFRNDGQTGTTWVFTDVTDELGVGVLGRTTSAVYGDYDNDGWLDLYVGTHHYELIKPPDSPESEYHRDHLFHNVPGPDGGRVFEDVADAVFPEPDQIRGLAHSCGFFDFDLDGDVDIYVVNEHFKIDGLDSAPTLLWRNDGPDGIGGWLFTSVAGELGCETASNVMGLAIGDYNNDGWFDFAMSDIGPNWFYRNNGGRSFSEVAHDVGVDRPTVPLTGVTQFGWGNAFLDYDLDGLRDFYVATGITVVPGAQVNPLFHNQGPIGIGDDGSEYAYVEEPLGNGADLRGTYRCVIRADFDHDGYEDMYLVAYGSEAVLLRNDSSGANYLALTLKGRISNRDAIGARVKVSAAGLEDQYQMVQSGSTTNGGHFLELIFGLGSATQADTVTIYWPSGQVSETTNVAANQRLSVEEPAIVPTSVDITGDPLVPSGASIDFGARAILPDGVELVVTDLAEWSVSSTAFCQVVAPGRIQTSALEAGQSVAVTLSATYEGVTGNLDLTVVDETVSDLTPPEVVINLANGGTSLETEAASIIVSGTASDNFEIVSVVWSTDQGFSGAAAGTGVWSSGVIPLEMGTNRITVSAGDAAGNTGSAIVTVVRAAPVVDDGNSGVNYPDTEDEIDVPSDPALPPAEESDQSGGTPEQPEAESDSTPNEATDPSAPETDEPVADSSEPGSPTEASDNSNHERAAPLCGAIGMVPFGLFAGAVLGLRARRSPPHRRM